MHFIQSNFILCRCGCYLFICLFGFILFFCLFIWFFFSLSLSLFVYWFASTNLIYLLIEFITSQHDFRMYLMLMLMMVKKKQIIDDNKKKNSTHKIQPTLGYFPWFRKADFHCFHPLFEFAIFAEWFFFICYFISSFPWCVLSSSEFVAVCSITCRK